MLQNILIVVYTCHGIDFVRKFKVCANNIQWSIVPTFNFP